MTTRETRSAAFASLGDLGPATSTTVFASVRDRLQLGILSGEFPPGARLHQSELATALGVSITPVRESLRELTAAGLVDFVENVGAVVHTPTADEADIIGEMLEALLPIVVRHAVRNISEDELRRAERICDDLMVCTSAVTWVELNRGFHNTLDGACRNQHLTKVMGQINDLMRLYVKVDVEHGTVRRDDEHYALLAAYRTRDVTLATKTYQEHLNATVKHAAAVLRGD